MKFINFECKTMDKNENLTSLGVMKKARTISTMASSARILVIRRDQNPLGKYDMSSRRLMEHSGSER